MSAKISDSKILFQLFLYRNAASGCPFLKYFQKFFTLPFHKLEKKKARNKKKQKKKGKMKTKTKRYTGLKCQIVLKDEIIILSISVMCSAERR